MRLDLGGRHEADAIEAILEDVAPRPVPDVVAASMRVAVLPAAEPGMRCLQDAGYGAVMVRPPMQLHTGGVVAVQPLVVAEYVATPGRRQSDGRPGRSPTRDSCRHRGRRWAGVRGCRRRRSGGQIEKPPHDNRGHSQDERHQELHDDRRDGHGESHQELDMPRSELPLPACVGGPVRPSATGLAGCWRSGGHHSRSFSRGSAVLVGGATI